MLTNMDLCEGLIYWACMQVSWSLLCALKTNSNSNQFLVTAKVCSIYKLAWQGSPLSTTYCLFLPPWHSCWRNDLINCIFEILDEGSCLSSRRPHSFFSHKAPINTLLSGSSLVPDPLLAKGISLSSQNSALDRRRWDWEACEWHS